MAYNKKILFECVCVVYDMCLLIHMAAESEVQPLFGSLWLFDVKMAERANSYDLELPGGDISHIYFLRLSFSRKKILECISK